MVLRPIPTKREGDAHFTGKILVKSPKLGNKAQRKVDYYSKNYQQKLLQEIITENYELVYQSRGKCENYRDTGVSKNKKSLSS